MLTDLLFEAGLIQFGLFVDSDGTPAPVRLALELLPSYPDILDEIASKAASLLSDTHADRLLCPADSFPLGLALSLRMRIPLVYSRGGHQPPVYDLVGAYDVGHPAVLVANTLAHPGAAESLIAGARRVGLNVHTIFVLIDLGQAETSGEMPVRSLLRFEEVIGRLEAGDRIGPGQSRAAVNWLKHLAEKAE